MVGTIGLFCMMLMVTADVFLRAAFNQPIKGATEISELLLVLVVFFGLAYCEAHRGHVRVEILTSYLRRRMQLLLDCVTTFIALAFFALIVWRSIVDAIEIRQVGEVFECLRIVVWPFRYIVAVGCFVFCLELLLRLGSDIAGLAKAGDSS